MGDSTGIGPGLAEGVRTGGQFLMQGLQMGQQRKRYAQYDKQLELQQRRYDQYDERQEKHYQQQERQFNRRIEILRGQAGLQPSYHELEPQDGAVPDTNSLAPAAPLASPDLPMSTMPVSPAAALGRMPSTSLASPFNMNPRYRRSGLP